MEGTIGEIRLFAGTFAPRYWAFCNGQLLSIASNTALFSILGTTYGGNGQTTFALPDLRGRTAVGAGQGPGLSDYSLGQVQGTPEVTLLTTNMPAHNHGSLTGTAKMPTTAAAANAETPGGNYFASDGSGKYDPNNSGSAIMKPAKSTLVVGTAGAGVPFNNMMPYLGMNYIICMFGIFPSRN